MYQVGFDFQALPGALLLKRSAAGGKWIAQTSFAAFTPWSWCQRQEAPANLRPSKDLREGFFAGVIASGHFEVNRLIVPQPERL
jgi:hypothetical protein